MGKQHAILVLILLLSACTSGAEGQPAASPTEFDQSIPPNPTTAVSPPPPPTILQPGPCEHLLWPVRDGAVWQYQFSYPDGSQQAASLSATVNGDSLVLTLQQSSDVVESQITCAPDGFYGALRGLTGHPDLGVALDLTNPDRPFLPSPDRLLPLGTTTAWDAQYDAGGTIDLPFTSGTRRASVTGGDVVIYATAEALESVSVSAGTFNALPVAQSVLFNLQVTTDDGLSGAVFGDAQTRLYWAEGVGLVRQEFEGGMLSSTLQPEPIILPTGITLELVEYLIAGA